MDFRYINKTPHPNIFRNCILLIITQSILQIIPYIKTIFKLILKNSKHILSLPRVVWSEKSTRGSLQNVKISQQETTYFYMPTCQQINQRGKFKFSYKIWDNKHSMTNLWNASKAIVKQELIVICPFTKK